MRAVLATALVWLAAASARADVVESCPLPWQRGGVGHGMSCSIDWPVMGVGALVCAVPVLLVAAVASLLLRRPPSGRTRGD